MGQEDITSPSRIADLSPISLLTSEHPVENQALSWDGQQDVYPRRINQTSSQTSCSWWGRDDCICYLDSFAFFSAV